MPGNKPESDPLGKLEEKIERVRRKHEGDADKAGRPLSPTHVSIEFAAGVLVGAGLGYWLDKWLDTQPVFFIICFFLGVAAGALNIYKLATKYKDDR